MDDILAALRHDPQTAIPEICSLKPQAQALITQGLSLRCRALLSQLPHAGAPLSDGDIRGLLAAAEALIRIDAQQPSWRLLLADVLTAAGTRGPGPRERVCARPLSPRAVPYAKREKEALDSAPSKAPPPAQSPSSWDWRGRASSSFPHVASPAGRTREGVISGSRQGRGVLGNSHICLFNRS